MNILAIDTATDILSVSLLSPGGKRHIEIDAGIRHSELLMETIDGLFRSSDLLPKELNLCACMKGPGSFTGLRIGYATAKSLALSLNIPMAAVPTLDCLGRHLTSFPALVLPVIDAKKDRFFAAFYRNGIRIGNFLDEDAGRLLNLLTQYRRTPEEPVIITGPGAQLFLDRMDPILVNLILDPSHKHGRSRELLEIVSENPNQFYEDETSGPLYLRKSDAELEKEAGQQ